MTQNWRTERALYEVRETGKGKNEVYYLLKTGEEIAEWCRTKREFYGYVEGLGGDKTYSCMAVMIRRV